jgi:hypothetical protein
MISFPLQMPATPGWSKINFTANNVVGVSRSPFTLQQQVYTWPGEGWSVSIAMPPMNQPTAEAWMTFLTALRGTSGTFWIGDVAHAIPRGTATGTPVVNTAQSAMSSTLMTRGWTSGATFLAGDFIQLGTGVQQRMYKSLTNQTANGGGYITFDIFPILREGVSDDQPITLLNTAGTFRLEKDTRQFDMDAARIFGISFEAEEAI